MSNLPELGRIVNLDSNSDREMLARERLRLGRDLSPTVRDSSTRWVDWGGMADVLGQPFDVTRIPLSKLEQMRRDPMIAFGLMFVKVPLIRAPWYIKCTDPQRAAFVDNALRKIYGRLILAWTNALDFGYSAIVKRFTYDTPDWEYYDKDAEEEKKVWTEPIPALLWKPFVPLSPRKVTPSWTPTGEFNGIHYASAMDGNRFPFEERKPEGPEIPLDWALWATNERESVFGSLWGYPRIGHAYRYWWSYWYKFGLSDRAFEKWADPPILVYHPDDIGLGADGTTRIDYTNEALTVAESARSGANIAMPSAVVTGLDERTSNVRAWQIEQLRSEANFDALNQTFEMLDVLRLRAVMVPEQALIEGKGGTSSRNVAATNMDAFQESQAVLKAQIDSHLNEWVIPQLVEANFGPGGPRCEIVTTGFDPTDVETFRNIITGIVNKTPEELPVDKREMLKQANIPVLSYTEIEKEKMRRAEEAAAMIPQNIPPKPGPNGQAGTTESGLYYAPRERIVLAMKDDKSGEELLELADRIEKMSEKVVELAAKEMPAPEVKVDLKPDVHVQLEMPEQEQQEEKKARKIVGENFLRNEEGDLVGKEFIYEEEESG